MQKAALQELVDHLEEFPHKTESVLRFAKMAAVKTEREPACGGEPDFHSTYRKLYRIPKDFLKQWLPTLASNPMAISEYKLARLEKESDGIIRNIFFVIANCLPETPWPQFCHSRAIFKKVFQWVHTEKGNRIDRIVLIEKGNRVLLDTSKFGTFILGPPGDCAKTYIEHIIGARADISDFTVPDSDYTILENFNPQKACVKVKRATAKCLDFFSDSQQDTSKADILRTKDYLQNITNEVHAEHEGADEEPDARSSAVGEAPPSETTPAPAPPHSRAPRASLGKIRLVAKRAT